MQPPQRYGSDTLWPGPPSIYDMDTVLAPHGVTVRELFNRQGRFASQVQHQGPGRDPGDLGFLECSTTIGSSPATTLVSSRPSDHGRHTNRQQDLVADDRSESQDCLCSGAIAQHHKDCPAPERPARKAFCNATANTLPYVPKNEQTRHTKGSRITRSKVNRLTSFVQLGTTGKKPVELVGFGSNTARLTASNASFSLNTAAKATFAGAAPNTESPRINNNPKQPFRSALLTSGKRKRDDERTDEPTMKRPCSELFSHVSISVPAQSKPKRSLPPTPSATNKRKRDDDEKDVCKRKLRHSECLLHISISALPQKLPQKVSSASLLGAHKRKRSDEGEYEGADEAELVRKRIRAESPIADVGSPGIARKTCSCRKRCVMPNQLAAWLAEPVPHTHQLMEYPGRDQTSDHIEQQSFAARGTRSRDLKSTVAEPGSEGAYGHNGRHQPRLTTFSTSEVNTFLKNSVPPLSNTPDDPEPSINGPKHRTLQTSPRKKPSM